MSPTLRKPLCTGVALLTLGLVTATAARAEPMPPASPAAHDLAEKFSKASQPSKPSDEAKRRKAEEDEMLARARAEAAARDAAAARNEAAAKSGPDADVDPGAQDARPQIGQRVIVTPPDEIQKAESERQRALELAREAEARALAEKLRRAEAARREKAAETARSEPRADDVPLPSPPPMALGRTPPPAIPGVAADPSLVTVLLVMEPGNKGIRRFNKTADPVLCLGPQCYISTGMGTPARSLHRHKALGAANTLGRRAGACRQSLSCVFRGVRISGAGATIQPVDLKVLVHDRRAPRDISGDTSCQVASGVLTCGRTIVAPGYRAWIVPERIAEQAGATALKSALTRGLVSQPQREAAINLYSKAP